MLLLLPPLRFMYSFVTLAFIFYFCAQDSLSLTLDEAQETLVGVLESRAKGIMQNIKADIMGGRDERVLEMAERLLK